MLCEICKHNEAVVFVKKVTDGKVSSRHLCMECARKAQVVDETMDMKIGDFIRNLIEKNIGYGENRPSLEDEKYNKIKCNSCGTTYGSLMKDGKVGCRECYKDLKKQILEILKKENRITEYEGAIPDSYKNGKQVSLSIRSYKRKLRKAIEFEEYEEAAKLRDVIRKLENEEER